MQIRYLSILLPVMLTGCDSLSARSRELPATPALVYIDGQISDSADVIAQTQQRIAPAVTAPPPRSVTPTTAAPVPRPTSVSLPLPSPVIIPALSRLVMTGNTPSVPVASLPLLRNQTTGQVIKRLLPADWQLRQENAATPALNTRLVSWTASDQWHQSLNRLLQEQHLYGHIDWNQKILTISTSPSLPGERQAATAPPSATVPATTPPPASVPSAAHPKVATVAGPKNPFSSSSTLPPANTSVRTGASHLIMTGTPTSEPVIFLSADKLTTEQWVTRLTPAGWSTNWGDIPPGTRSRPVHLFGVNDQWYRGLDKLLTGQNLWGHLNWTTRKLLISSSSDAAVLSPASRPLAGSPVTMDSGSHGQARVASVPSAPPAPQVWVAEKGHMLHQTIIDWAAKKGCDVPGQGPHWSVVWSASVDYPIDVRFEKTGNWQQVLKKTFDLYQSVKTPLNSTLYPEQCLVQISDKTP